MNNLPKLNLRYLLITRKFALLAAGVVAGCLALILLVIVPQFQASLNTWGTLNKETKAADALEKKSAELANFASSPLLAKSNQVELLLPNKKPLLELLTGLYQVASLNQVTFTDVELSPGKIASDSGQTVNKKVKTTGTEYDSMDVALTVQGDLSQLNRFFDAIENVAPLSIVTRLTLNQHQATLAQRASSVPAATPTTKTFEADIILTTYYFTKSVSAALQAALPPITPAEEELVGKLDGFTYVTLKPQLDIQGGGQNDLFGTTTSPVNGLEILQSLRSQVATASGTTSQP